MELQQNDRLAVTLGVRFALSTGLPSPLWGCLTVALLWDAGALGHCAEVGVYSCLLERNHSEVADPREFGLGKNATRPFPSVLPSPPRKAQTPLNTSPSCSMAIIRESSVSSASSDPSSCSFASFHGPLRQRRLDRLLHVRQVNPDTVRRCFLLYRLMDHC
jgi:hypothetical protein